MADFVYLVKRAANAYKQQNRTWSVGDKMYTDPSDYTTNSAVAKSWVWECTTGGTSTAKSTWVASVTQDVTTVTQNGVVWTARKPGYSSGTTRDWAFAAPIMQIISNLIGGTFSAGDRVFTYIDKGFTLTADDASTLYPNATADNYFISVDSAQGTSPTAVDPGAEVRIAQNQITYGCTMVGGGGGHLVDCRFKYDVGSMTLGGTVIRPIIDMTGAGAASLIYAHTAQFARVFDLTVQNVTTTPNTLFDANSGAFEIDGADLSNLAAGFELMFQSAYNAPKYARFANIKLPSGYSGTMFSVSQPAGLLQLQHEAGFCQSAENVSAGALNYNFTGASQRWDTITDDASIYRSGGATDGGTPVSRKVVFANNSSRPCAFLNLVRRYPLTTAEDTAWSAGAAKTLSVHLIHDSATNIKDGDIWMRVTVLDTTGYTLSSLVTTEINRIFATPADLAASSETWVGTGGFTNPNKQKLSVTINPRIKGWIRVELISKLTSKTIYVCPKVDIT